MQPRAGADNDAWDHPMLSRLVRFYNYYNPSKLVVANDMLKDAIGNEEALFEALRRKYGPEPDAFEERKPAKHDAEHRRRLTRFYQRYNPSKMHEVNELLTAFQGREDALFSALTEKYGPEPGADTSSRVPPEILHMLEENKRLKHRRQADVLWTISENHKARTRRRYYYRWLEWIWWRKNRGIVESVVSEGRTDLMIEKQNNQQLRDQVEFLRDKIKQYGARQQAVMPVPLPVQPEPVYAPSPSPSPSHNDILSSQLSQVLSQQQQIMRQQAEHQELLNKITRTPLEPQPEPQLQHKPLQHYRSSLKYFPPPGDRTSVACGTSFYQPTEYDKASVACGMSVASSPAPTPRMLPKNSPRRRSRASLSLAEPIHEASPRRPSDAVPPSSLEWKPGYEPMQSRYPEVTLPPQHRITQEPPVSVPSALRKGSMPQQPSGYSQYSAMPDYLGYEPANDVTPTRAPQRREESKESTGRNALVTALLHTHPMVQNNADLMKLLDIGSPQVDVSHVREAPAPVPLPATVSPPMHNPPAYHPALYGVPSYSKYSEESAPPSIHVHLPQQQPRLSTREKSRIVDDLVKEITGKSGRSHRSKRR